jgi:hypothetical protein
MSKNDVTTYHYWFDDEYRVTEYKDAGITQIEKLVKRRKNHETWVTIFHSHTELLRKLTPQVRTN